MTWSRFILFAGVFIGLPVGDFFGYGIMSIRQVRRDPTLRRPVLWITLQSKSHGPINVECTSKLFEPG
jgi:hypothetical protein